MQTPLWTPSELRRSTSLMNLFQTFVSTRLNRSFVSYRDFHTWSVKEGFLFWDLLSEFVGIRWQTPPSQAAVKNSPGMRGISWFPNGKLNFAANLLPESSDNEVIISYAEGNARSSLTARQLRNAVSRCAASLSAKGVREGDCVAGVLANGPEAVIAMLAAASLGAVWSSCSPDFGTSGIYDRMSQVQPKAVFVTRQYQYNGKNIQTLAQTGDALDKLKPSPVAVIVCDHMDKQRDEFWDFCGGRSQLGNGDDALSFTPRQFNDPLYILFSSGTTGLPKCIVHGVGGTLLQHKKELMLHSDIKPKDILFYYTTCGWMMWNWMVSALSCNARIVTFDGSPTWPNINVLWDIIRKENVSHFGTSPKFLSACMSNPDFSPVRSGPLSSLNTLLSTGSPLLAHHFEWVYAKLPHVHLASISGGTDIVSCFMLGNPTLPVYAGEIQGAGLGMAIESWNEQGQPVYAKKGELVCVSPFVSMPVCFLNDPDGSRYNKAYFEHYKHRDVWRHGDFIEISEHGGITVFGRSDATLNPGGVRIGTSELYRVVEGVAEVLDAIAVGQQRGDDSRIVLFVKLRPETTWSKELELTIKASIRQALTPRHVPEVILPVSDIPYTRSGKKVEIAVTKVIHGEEVPNKASLANPECLAQYQNMLAINDSSHN